MNNNTKETFLQLKTREDVANILGIDERSLRYFLYKVRPENMYTVFTIPKKDGNLRKISAPKKELKNIQKKLALVLNEVYTPKVCAYGFVSGKNIVDNASRHTHRQIVLNMDLKDFFSQIHFGRVRGLLINKPYSIGDEAATTIAQIVCCNGVLPQGAPTSPVITNMICAPLDNNLMKLAKETGCTYTRYADDISFSTYKKTFDESIAYVDDGRIILGNKLEEIIKKNSFEINPKKITLRSKKNRQEVTGLTVNEFPNLRRSYVRQLRAIMHSAEKYGLYLSAKKYISEGLCRNPKIIQAADDKDQTEVVVNWFKQVLTGKINYIKQVKGPESYTFLSFAKLYNEITDSSYFDISKLDLLSNLISKNTFVIERCCDGDYVQGSAFFVKEYGMFTSYHVTETYEIYDVNKIENRIGKKIGSISNQTNLICRNRDIDYALYNVPFLNSTERSLELGDSKKLKVGSEVIVVGYPNYSNGASANIQRRRVSEIKPFLGAQLYLIDGIIVHGASGGVVLDEEYKVVGIIKAGISTLDEAPQNENQGFVPMHIVIENTLVEMASM